MATRLIDDMARLRQTLAEVTTKDSLWKESGYQDSENPSLSMEEVRQARIKRDAKAFSAAVATVKQELFESLGLNKPKLTGTTWTLPNGREIDMPMIDSLEKAEAWLKQESLHRPVSNEDSDTALHHIAYKLCFKTAWRERVTQKDRWATIATDSAANAVERLTVAILKPEDSIKTHGVHEGKTQIQASLDTGGGAFPILRLLASICLWETLTELKRQSRYDSRHRDIEAAVEVGDNYDSVTTTRSFAQWLHSLATDSERDSGKDTLRADMFLLAKLYAIGTNFDETEQFSNTGHKGYQRLAKELGWTRYRYLKALTEVRISLSRWEDSPEEAKAKESALRQTFKNMTAPKGYK